MNHKMNPARMIRTAASVVVAACFGLAVCLDTARACAFHSYKPENTVIDWLLKAEHLVTARASQQDDYTYQVAETLRDGEGPVPITWLADGATRNRLAANPDDALLFAYDVSSEKWRNVAYLSTAFRQVVDDVLTQEQDWGTQFHAARFRFFEDLLDHTDPAIRGLAIAEIDKAPYALLKTMAVKPSADRLLSDLWSPDDYQYQAIRILLLGLTGAPEARAEILAFVDRTADWDWARNLGAYSTALVEIDGVAGVELLDATLLSDHRQPLDKLEMVVEALAIHHGVGPRAVRDGIARALDRLVRERPQAAPLIARQFGSRNDFSREGALRGALRSKQLQSAEAFMSVASYIAQAGQPRTGNPLLSR